ncbi:hypothetical protein QQM79_16120 [Marinobacteraceae bacterium S3BR75-40.1]
MIKSKKMRLASAISMTALLTACGGGGSGGSGSSDQEPQAQDQPSTTQVTKGRFVDSPVSGLRYEGNQGSAGWTNSQGEFDYKENEIIRFFLGNNTLLGSSGGKSMVTPADLLENQNGSADRKTNVLRLLQTVDADGDPSNGIEIPSIAGEALDAVSLDLDQSGDMFENSAPVSELLAAISKSDLVTADDAEAHFNATLEESGSAQTPGFANGAVWQVTETTTGCEDQPQIKIFTFANDQVAIQGKEIDREQTGTDSSGNPVYGCVASTIDLTASAQQWSQMFCAQADCNSLSAVNTAKEDTDSNGRIYIEWLAGSPLIKREVRYRDGNGNFNGYSHDQTLIKLTDGGETPSIDMTGTWNMRGYESACPEIEAQGTVTFNETSVTTSGEETSTSPCAVENIEETVNYTDAPDFLAEGPVYAPADLNREYPDPDNNGDRVFVHYDYKTDTVTRIKDRGDNYSTIILTRASN